MAIFADVPTVLNSALDSMSIIHDVNASEIIQTSTSVPAVGALSMVHSPTHAFDPVEEDHFLVHIPDLEPSCSSLPRYLLWQSAKTKSYLQSLHLQQTSYTLHIVVLDIQ
jgi:hypothetical protein